MIRILTIDIGNTRASFARFENRVLVWRKDVCTTHFPEMAREIFAYPVDACVVSNVSKNRAFFEDWVKTQFKERVFCIETKEYPHKIQYSPVESLGHDRLANAFAAHDLAPHGAIVVDCGTATHFDVIAPNGEFLGGPILAGIETMLKALTDRIPHLPEITLDPGHVEALSQNTVDAINAGTILCVAGGVERIITDIANSLDFEPSIILTGGNAQTIAPYMHYDIWCADLTLKGLALYAEFMLRKRGWLKATA